MGVHMGINDSAIVIQASSERVYAKRCALLDRAREEIETAVIYESEARYFNANATRVRALAHLEAIGLRNLMVNPDA